MPGTRTLQFYCLDAVSKMPRSEEEMQTREVRRFIASHPFPDEVQPIIVLLKQCQPTDAAKELLCDFLMKRGKLDDLTIPQVIVANITVLDFQNCPGISDVACFAIAGAQCTRLKKFDLRLLRKTRPEVTSAGVIAVVESCKLSLRTLKLARCTNVDDQALDVISRRCVGLRALDLNGCTKVTDQGIKNLARLRTVQSLGLSATQLTDDGCMFVAEQAITRTLGELAISNCAKVSDVGATALISSCKHLKMFMHHGCPLITEASRELLVPHADGHVTWTVQW